MFITTLLLAAGTVVPQSVSGQPANPCRLILPDKLPAVVGHEINIYFDNVVLVQNLNDYEIVVNCAKGMQQQERWTFTPKEADLGDIPLTLTVHDAENKPIASANTKRVVIYPGFAHGYYPDQSDMTLEFMHGM
jgi:hypothetical protein